MKIGNCATFLAVCVLFTCSSGCHAQSDEFSRPVKQGEVFIQPTFGLRLPLPDGWSVASRDVIDYRKGVAAKFVIDDAALAEKIKQKVHRLLVAQKHPAGEAPLRNSTISVNANAADIDLVKGLDSPVEYQQKLLRDFADGGLQTRVLAKPKLVKLGGRECSVCEVLIDFPKVTIYQKHYDTFFGGVVLNIQAVASSRNELDAIAPFLEKVEFAPTPDN